MIDTRLQIIKQVIFEAKPPDDTFVHHLIGSSGFT